MAKNSVFVSTEDKFDITVYYTKDGKFHALGEEELKTSGKDKEKYDSLTMTFRFPDYLTSRQVMRDSCNEDGRINFSLFNTAAFTYLAKGWDAADENEAGEAEEIPFNFEKLNQLRPDIALKFIELLIAYLRENELYESIILS